MHYEPEPNFITADVARDLARIAHVTVVTAHPNYPHGRFYPGTRYWWPSRTEEGGVVVWRLPFLVDHSTSPFRRGLSYLSFAVICAVFAPFVAPRPHIVWVYHGPFTTALAALWFKWVRRARLVFTSADLWPESLGATAVLRAGPLMSALYAYSRWINRRADLIVCSTRGTLERYVRDGIPSEKLTFVPVWVGGIPDRLDGDSPHSAAARRIVYAGNLGPAQNLATVVRAAALMRVSHPDLVFDFYGAGASTSELQALATDLGASNVVFHGRVSPETAFQASSSAFAQIVSLKRTTLFRMTIPSKLAFALAAGAPVLCALEGEAAQIASESSAAIPFDSDDPESLVGAIHRLVEMSLSERDDIRRRARAYYRRHFDRVALLQAYKAQFIGR